jgi:hypothetical protein
MTDAAVDTAALMTEIRDFCETYGIAETTFGRHAVNDGKFVGRLSQGRWIADQTADRVHGFMKRVRAGEIVLRGRPRRKKDEARAEKMEELISRETSVRTAGSLAFHEQRQRHYVFSNTTNEAWVLADRAADELRRITPGPDGMRLFCAPMDNGVAMTRMLRAVHAMHPDLPLLVVMKGRGLEDLRNTMGRLVDRLAEHPETVFVFTNMYFNEAVDLTKRSDDNPADVVWHDLPLEGAQSHDFQQQVSELYGTLSGEWLVRSGDHGQPVYAIPSVVTMYRADQKKRLKRMIPEAGDPALRYDYALLNHPYLHTHTMTFRTDYVLSPLAERLAPGGRMSVIQSLGEDPAHEIVAKVWPDQPMPTTSRYDIMRDLKRSLDKGRFTYSGLTDTDALFRFDMHTLPVRQDYEIGTLSLSAAWNNAVYFAEVREDLAEAAMREEDARYLDVTRDVLRTHGGLWFVNEAFSVTRLAGS